MLVIRTRAVLSFAILSGLLAYACPRPAIAFEATAPLTASSGNVGITVGDCTGDGKALTFASGAFGCNTITGTLQKIKVLTSDFAMPEQADGGTAIATQSDLSGLDVTGAEKTFIVEAVLVVEQHAVDPTVYIGFGGVSGSQVATSHSTVSCVGDSNKADRASVNWSGAYGGFGSVTAYCDMPTGTQQMTIRVIFTNAAGSTSTKTANLYWQGAAYSGSVNRDATLKAGSSVRVWEVDLD
jgi:hypothetical protein